MCILNRFTCKTGWDNVWMKVATHQHSQSESDETCVYVQLKGEWMNVATCLAVNSRLLGSASVRFTVSPMTRLTGAQSSGLTHLLKKRKKQLCRGINDTVTRRLIMMWGCSFLVCRSLYWCQHRTGDLKPWCCDFFSIYHLYCLAVWSVYVYSCFWSSSSVCT